MKSEMQYLNRAYRQATKGWLGAPGGFKNKREWKRACRIFAGNFEPMCPLFNQQIADEAVIDDMSYWDADYDN